MKEKKTLVQLVWLRVCEQTWLICKAHETEHERAVSLELASGRKGWEPMYMSALRVKGKTIWNSYCEEVGTTCGCVCGQDGVSS